MKFNCLKMSMLGLLSGAASVLCAADFAAVRHEPGFTLPSIVLQQDPQADSGYNWEKISARGYSYARKAPTAPAFYAVNYLREGIARMTGKELAVISSNDLSRGIVLVLLKNAPDELKNDPAIKHALRDTGEDSYNHIEAYFVRTESARVLIVANTLSGLQHGIVELLESAGYELLGMGPNWTHVPDYTTKSLIFSLERSGRPIFYIRDLYATCNQHVGIGTLSGKLPHSADEPVEVSYDRWRMGARMMGRSMPAFPGHSLQNYHTAVAEKMKQAGVALKTRNLDLSSAYVRAVVFEDMKKRAEEHFQKTPKEPLDRFFIFGTDPEDGAGNATFAENMENKSWYVDYLKNEGVKFAQPYMLNGVKGLDQLQETWDPTSVSDSVFGFNNWLLREYDKWIDSLPPAQRVSANGESKKDLVRCSLYSYNFHDVPPNFNLDPRIRVMIAGYPKHRGKGKWKNFASQQDIAEAFRVLLPREPSGDYWILSLAYYHDHEVKRIRGCRTLSGVHQSITTQHAAGFRALTAEVDFNFGKQGLEYYLFSKMLWDAKLSKRELAAIRKRWLQRSYGSGWQIMDDYYNYIAKENFTVSAPHTWALTIRKINEADTLIDPEHEPAEQRRLDDLKQFWYFYYLLDSGQNKANSPALREFAWKGQMSYMTAMHMVTGRFLKCDANYKGMIDVRALVGEPLISGPAHYTPEETQKWWAKVCEHWRAPDVADFTKSKLADGSSAGDVDLNDLVEVNTFKSSMSHAPFQYESAWYPASLLTTASNAGDEIGCVLYWQYKPDDKKYQQHDVSFTISRWDPEQREWQERIHSSTKPSALLEAADENQFQWVELRFAVQGAGTYKITLKDGAPIASLSPLGYDLKTNSYSNVRAHTYFQTLRGSHGQSPAYFYIPKGTKSLDLETWVPLGHAKLHLNSGLPSTELKRTRSIDIAKVGTHSIPLQSGEDGSIAVFESAGFAFPHLYSVPPLWAKTPSELLLPRAIAKSDGLIVK
jgi:hypothetical protein